MFDDHSVTLTCPNCGCENAKTIGWIKTHNQFQCSGCQGTVRVEADQARKELARVDKAVDDLRRSLRGLGKRR